MKRKCGARRRVLKASERGNRADAVAYCVEKLKRRIARTDADTLASLAEVLTEKAKANFLVLRMFLDARTLGEKVTVQQVEEAAQNLTGSVEAIYEFYLSRLPVRNVRLRELLGAFATAQGPVTQAQLCGTFLQIAPEDVEWGFKHVGQFLSRGGFREDERGVITYRLWHETFREYLQERFSQDLLERHGQWAERCGKWRSLRGYERLYALRHLPLHLRGAANWNSAHDPLWDGLASTLCDLEFLEAKCGAGMTYDLVADYGPTLEALPEARERAQRDQKLEEDVDRYSKEIAAYAKKWNDARDRHDTDPERKPLPRAEDVPQPAAPASVRPWAYKEIRAETERLYRNPTRLEQVRAFGQFMAARSHVLSRFAPFPGYVFQEAHNFARGGAVAEQAQAALFRARAPLVLLLPCSLPKLSPFPPLLQTLEGHGAVVTSVAVTANGRRAVSVSGGEISLNHNRRDRTLRVWDLKTGELLRTIEGHKKSVESVALTPDGRRAVSGSSDCTLRVWDLKTGELLRTIEGHKGSVWSVALTPDGRRAVWGSSDCTLRVWDLETGASGVLEGHKDPVTSVALTPDGRRAVSGSYDCTLRVWDLETGASGVLEGHEDWVESVALTPDGRRAVSGSSDCTLRVWDLETGASGVLEGHQDRVTSVALTPDGRRAVSGSHDCTLRVWDLETGASGVLEGHEDSVISVALTPDGRRAVSGSNDCTLRVWDLETGASGVFEGRAESIKSITHSLDGRRAVSVSRYSDTDIFNALRVWDVETGASRLLRGHTESVNVALTPDGRRAVAVSVTGREWAQRRALRVWDLETGASHLFRGHTDGASHLFRGHTESVKSVTLTPDGRRAVSGDGHNLRVWDLKDGALLQVLHTWYGADKFALTPDGRRAVWCDSVGLIDVLDLETGTPLQTLKGYFDDDMRCGQFALILTPDGRRAVSGSDDGSIRVCDLKTGALLQTIEDHTNGVERIALTPDGRRAVSITGARDNIIVVSDLETGECVAMLSVSDTVTAVSMAGAGKYLALGTNSRQILFATVVNLSPGPLLATAVRLWAAGNPGRWDRALTTLCPGCGVRFPAGSAILGTTRSIAREARLSPSDSPCLDLPPEAWNEPRLISQCPSCQVPLRFNPFVVDNRGRWD